MEAAFFHVPCLSLSVIQSHPPETQAACLLTRGIRAVGDSTIVSSEGFQLKLGEWVMPFTKGSPQHSTNLIQELK